MFSASALDLQHEYTKQLDQYLVALYNSTVKKIYSGNQQQQKMKLRKHFPGEYVHLTNSIIVNRLEQLVFEADKIAISVITPWTIEKVKSTESTGLFLPALDFITIGNNAQNRSIPELDLTEEMMFGIFCVIPEDIAFWFEYTVEVYKQKQIKPEDVLDNFTKRTEAKYTANTKYGKVYFDSRDVIEGVIMSSEWIKQDPHTFLTDVTEDGEPLVF